MPTIALTGLPGTGKTRLALELATQLMAAAQPALVLHTDILKVTLRELFPQALAGAGYSGNFLQKVSLVRPFLLAQSEKADRDGYMLIIEGTLALGFHPPTGWLIRLQLSEDDRQHRIHQKHASAQQTLQMTSLQAYQQALDATTTPATWQLEANQPATILATQILTRIGY